MKRDKFRGNPEHKRNEFYFSEINAFDFEAIEIDVPIRAYIPLFDPLGPYLFYP